jgi:serine/threonine protein phosphatase 1
VHANAHPDKALSDQSNLTLFWEKFEGSPAATRPHISGKTLICGHTAQMSGRPKNLGHAICIDTCPYADGWLTCLDVDTGHYWQANQEGASREGTLEACVA